MKKPADTGDVKAWKRYEVSVYYTGRIENFESMFNK